MMLLNLKPESERNYHFYNACKMTSINNFKNQKFHELYYY